MIQITIKDFQSLRDVTLDVEGLTVLVGPSDRGKSAALRAVEGALFNRPGDQFIRHGAKKTIVTVTLPEDEVTWEKGAGANRFIRSSKDPAVDDIVYAKVGQKAPEFLQALGFREVTIGARLKDDGKLEGGETLRPQVARQFGDQVFLLDRPGPFVNEVIVRVSRLGVLQRAGRSCSLDLRQTKSLLKVRKEDLTEAKKEAARLAGIAEVRERVALLRARHNVMVQLDVKVQTLRRAVEQRRFYAQLAALPLPKPAKRALTSAVVYDALAPLVAARKRLPVLPDLPPPRKFSPEAQQLINHWVKVRPLLIDRRQNLNWVLQYGGEAGRAEGESHRAQIELHQAKHDARVCPLCEKPFA